MSEIGKPVRRRVVIPQTVPDEPPAPPPKHVPPIPEKVEPEKVEPA
jgi:hypothetical protein